MANSPTLEKFALNPYEAAAKQALKQDTIRRIAQLGLAGVGLGAAARGGMGLYNLARRNKPREEDESSAEIPAVSDSFKTASESDNPANTFSWVYPAAATVGLGGMYGGWKAIDGLMDSRREKEQDDELESAKTQFRQALMSPKQAENNELGRELDGLFDEVKEAADNPNLLKQADLKSILNQSANVYGLYALLAGGMAGSYAYNKSKGSSNPEVLQKALKRRRRMQVAARPDSIRTEVTLPPRLKEDEDIDLSPKTSPALLGFDTGSPPRPY